jgi:hypothetical protein
MTHRSGFLLGIAMLCAQVAALGAQSTVDHGRFDRLLSAHVVDGTVDYAAFASSRDFTGYLGSLSTVDPAQLARDERLAFWINAYNAFTIELINRNEERRSIRKISRPWGVRFIRLGGRMLSLDDIEHEIIRKEFGEPRIHFALVCAAKGCPPLRTEAYTGAALERQLDDQAMTFLTRTPAKNRVDVATGTAYLSPIFKFRDYERDFGGTREAIGRYVATYLRRAGMRAEADLLERGRFALKYTDYDWSLNGRALAR